MPPLVHRSMHAHSYRADQLVSQIQDGTLWLEPPYQRGDVWTLPQRRALIKSLLLGVPVAGIVLNRRGDNRAWERVSGRFEGEETGHRWWVCIDGKQRLTTLRLWMESCLTVPSGWFDPGYLLLPEFSTVRYRDLTLTGQRMIGHRFTLSASEATLSCVEEEREVYLLLNSAGTAHTAEDLERARKL